MTANELKEQYISLYDYMASSRDPKNMKAFGRAMNGMMDWFIANKPEIAEAWIDKLEAIRWKNYLTPSEADSIISAMTPPAPWTRDQWKAAMEKNGFEMEEWPCYNICALYVTMNMIMSRSSATLAKYASDENKMFEFVHALALDKLKDADKRFDIRHYFSL